MQNKRSVLTYGFMFISLIMIRTAVGFTQEPVFEVKVSSGAIDRINSIVSFYVTSGFTTDHYIMKDRKGVEGLLQIDNLKLSWFIIEKFPKMEFRQYMFSSDNRIDAYDGVVSSETDDHSVTFSVNGNEMISYCHSPRPLPDNVDSIDTRAGYIHPVRIPIGVILTKEFAEVHRHYYGIWSAWTRAKFEVHEEKYIFIVHSDRVEEEPEWLLAYIETDLKIDMYESEEVYRELTIYKKEVFAGDRISLGMNSNDGTITSMMYLVLTGTIDPVTVDESRDMHDDFALSQNYPNPFNPSMTIEYKISHDAQVMITVYDVTGRQVPELADSYHEAGVHSVVWNARLFPSGVYNYCITAGDFSDVKLLMLVK